MICLVDLDDFKTVNDAFGYRTGDRSLHIIGRRLMNRFSDCTIAKASGSAFLLHVPHHHDARVLCDDILSSVAERVSMMNRRTMSSMTRRLHYLQPKQIGRIRMRSQT